MPPAPRTTVEPWTIQELVHLAARKKKTLPSRLWRETVADLVLSLRKPEDKTTTATNLTTQRAILAEWQERADWYAGLTTAQRIELAEWKSRLM